MSIINGAFLLAWTCVWAWAFYRGGRSDSRSRQRNLTADIHHLLGELDYATRIIRDQQATLTDLTGQLDSVHNAWDRDRNELMTRRSQS